MAEALADPHILVGCCLGVAQIIRDGELISADPVGVAADRLNEAVPGFGRVERIARTIARRRLLAQPALEPIESVSGGLLFVRCKAEIERLAASGRGRLIHRQAEHLREWA